MKHRLLIVLGLVSLVAIAGCEAIATSVFRRPADWAFIQSVGGIAMGAPRRDDRGHVWLPIRCNVAGENITVHPTAMNSGVVCERPVVRINRDRTIDLTVRTTVATRRHSEALCPAADLGRLGEGRFAVLYASPDGARHPLGFIQVPSSGYAETPSPQ